MILCISILFVLSLIISLALPYIYSSQKQKVIKNCIELASETEQSSYHPLMSFVIFTLPALIYYLSSDLLTLGFCYTLAIAAYTDVCKRWIPDLIIYCLLAISIYSLHSKDLILSLFAAVYYLLPIVLLSLYGYVTKKESWIASGDYYIFPSIGLMLIPEYASGIMLITLLIMLILVRYIKLIPLITIAYFTFTGFNVCLFLGFL